MWGSRQLGSVWPPNTPHSERRTGKAIDCVAYRGGFACVYDLQVVIGGGSRMVRHGLALPRFPRSRITHPALAALFVHYWGAGIRGGGSSIEYRSEI